MLLGHVLRKAQELGIDVFLLAIVGGFPIYKSMGFTLLDSIVQDATAYGGNDNYAFRFMEYTVNPKQ